MSQFGGVLDYLPVGTLTDADSDLFLPVGENTVFVSVDRYEAVATNEISLTADGAETYIAGADDDGLIRRELRFTVDDKGVYTVDNSCYDADYDGTGTYYRHIVYEPYDGTQEGELSVKAYLNNIELVGSGWSLVYDGLFPLSALYTDDTLSVSLADGVTSGTVVIGDSCFFNSAAEGETKVAEAVAVFGLPDGTVVDENTRLEEKKDGVSYTADHIRAHIGTADQAIQVIAGIGVNRLNNVTDKITSLKLGEVLEITDDSAKILRTLKDTAINNLSDALDTIVLSDATDIILDEYTPAADGAYVAIDGYYTLYNPSRHEEGMQRYDKIPVDGSASAALQRLAGVAIPDISAAFSEMVLADALSVDPDTYAEVAAPVEGHTYYVFNATYGYPERITYSASEHADLAVFDRTPEGDSNAVLKQLAYVAIDDVSAAMDGIVGNTLLSDIIDIFRYTTVKDYESGEAGWLIGYNPYFTEGSGDDATRYAYVYNGDGNYYKTEFFYFAVDETANAGWLGEATVKTFSYERINDPEDFATQQKNQNVYVKEANDFRSNPALVAYYAAKYKDSVLAVCELYKRVDRGGGEGQSTVSVYPNGDGDCGLYVKYFNKYYRYDPENPAHWGEPLYFKFTGGYYPASEDTADETAYYYDYKTGEFTTTKSGTTTQPDTTSSAAFAVKMPVSAYYTEINSTLAEGDAGFTDGTPVYSKRECETVYKESDDYQNDPSNRFVEIDGEFVQYDESAHAGMTVYERYIGYLGNDAANDGGSGLTPLSSVKVQLVTEKSSAVLLAIADRALTINTLDENIKNFTIEELMDIEEGSIFDDPDIRTATINTLSEAITTKFSTMSISDLIRWANVRGVDKQVLFILEDVKIADFFTSLEYNNDNNGTITVNMEKLLGVTTTP